MGNFHSFDFNPDLTWNVINSGIILVCAIAVIFILKRALGLMAKHLNMPMLDTRPPRLVIRYSVLLIAVALILKQFGNNDMGTVLKIIGTVLGLVAIGFVAVWSVLSNLLCTFFLILFKPFAIGDEVEIPGDSVSGKVVDITLVYTILRNPNGEYVQVPNNTFFQKIFKRRAGTAAVELSHQLVKENPVE